MTSHAELKHSRVWSSLQTPLPTFAREARKVPPVSSTPCTVSSQQAVQRSPYKLFWRRGTTAPSLHASQTSPTCVCCHSPEPLLPIWQPRTSSLGKQGPVSSPKPSC